MLGVLATVGLFFLFAYSAGYVRIGQRQPLAEVVKAAADGLDVGVLIASRDGEAMYANTRFERIVGAGEVDRLVALQEFLSGDAASSAALFRLTRAAERGETLAEEFAVGRLLPGERTRRTLQLAVNPCRPKARIARRVSCCGASPTSPPIVAARRCALPASRCSLPSSTAHRIGLASVAADGTLLHVNGTLARWIGRTPKSVIDQHLKLADIASGEGAGLVSRLTGNADDQSATLDVDLTREDGRVLPRAPAGAARCRAARA